MNVETRLSAVLLLIVLAAGYSSANMATTCHSCYGINCQRTALSAVQTCSDLLDYCVTIYEDSKVLYKGCSLEIPVDLQSRCDSPMNPSCHRCNTDRCNNVGSMRFACVQCDSTQDSNCAENAATLQPVVCMAPTATNSYCYVKASNSGSTIQRGCSTTVSDQKSCLEDANCLLCSSADVRGCNSVNIAVNSTVGNRFIRFLR